MTREEFLTDLIQYYSEDINRRCTNTSSNGCYYSPKSAGKEGVSEGCAIGRHLDPDLQEELDGTDGDSGSGVENSYIFEKLPAGLRELGRTFLKRCQSLHDGSENWEIGGLTFLGKLKLDSIINDFSLNEDSFKEYL